MLEDCSSRGWAATAMPRSSLDPPEAKFLKIDYMAGLGYRWGKAFLNFNVFRRGMIISTSVYLSWPAGCSWLAESILANCSADQ